jgi:hypothetical protein
VRALVALTGLLGACTASTAAPPVTAPARPVAVPASFPDDPRPLPRFHSTRFALSLPLPDGHAWRIDDHSQSTLVATHAPTHSRVVAATYHMDALVGRTQCEAQARAQGLVPSGELHVLEDVTGITQQTFDTRTVVAIELGSGPSQPLVGHVMAFGGFLRKCFVFDYATQVDGAADEPVLSARLAYARARILGGMELDVQVGSSTRRPEAGLPPGSPPQVGSSTRRPEAGLPPGSPPAP